MTEKKKKDPRVVQLKRVRLSFTDTLLEKDAVEDGKPKYGCNLIVEKDQPEFDDNNGKIMSAIRAAGDEAWGKPEAFKDILEDNPKRVCYRPGARFRNKDGETYKGYDGNFGLSASTPGGGQRRPALYDRRKRPVSEEDILDVMYGGSYADAIVSFYGTDKGGRGIFCVIEGIRSHEEGERMGGGVTVTEDMFDDLPDDNSFDEGEDGDAGDEMIG